MSHDCQSWEQPCRCGTTMAPKPLERHQIATHLAQMSYKPGWKWGVKPAYEADDYWVFWAVAEVTDATNHKKIVPIKSQEYIPQLCVRSLDDLKHIMRNLFAKLEMHELDEFFKYDGEHVNEPHPERKINAHYA